MLKTAINAIADQTTEPLLEVDFPVTPGSKISSLHNYSLYCALKGKLPWIKDCPCTAISTIAGIRNGKGQIETAEFSRLQIRTPLSKASQFYALAGQSLSIGQAEIALKVPTITLLRPKSTLKARIVVIHLKPREEFPSPDRFLAVATRQLNERGIQGRVSLLLRRGALDNKILLVKQQKIPGYGVQVSGLSESDSLKLQEVGLGGKRKMGAGYFL
jgi:CRISPR-associated endonuclease/helicase Cas3